MIDKELLKKLSPYERIEYFVKYDTLNLDYGLFGMMAGIYGLLGYIITKHTYMLCVALSAFLVFVLIGTIAEAILEYKLDREFTEKIIMNMEVKK